MKSLLLLLALAALLPGCNKSTESEQPQFVDAMGMEIPIRSDGTVSLPPDWPKDLIALPGARLVGSSNTDIPTGVCVLYEYNGTPKAVLDHFLTYVPKIGYDNSDCSLSPTTAFGHWYKNGYGCWIETPVRQDKKLVAVAIRKTGSNAEFQEHCMTYIDLGLPPDFPTSRLPVYPGCKPDFATFDTMGMAELNFITRDPAEKVAEYYQKRFTDMGYKLSGYSGNADAPMGDSGEFQSSSERVLINIQRQKRPKKGTVVNVSYKTVNFMRVHGG